MDLFVAGGTPLDEQQLRRSQAVDLGGGRVIRVHPPEDILPQKLRWFRRGGETSDRQWRDTLGIARTQGPPRPGVTIVSILSGPTTEYLIARGLVAGLACCADAARARRAA